MGKKTNKFAKEIIPETPNENKVLNQQ